MKMSLFSEPVTFTEYHDFVFQEPTAILSRKKVGGYARGWRVRRVLLDCIPVKFQDVKFTVPNCKHEIFELLKLFHNLFAICC